MGLEMEYDKESGEAQEIKNPHMPDAPGDRGLSNEQEVTSFLFSGKNCKEHKTQQTRSCQAGLKTMKRLATRGCDREQWFAGPGSGKVPCRGTLC